jgi:hypothetical protein
MANGFNGVLSADADEDDDEEDGAHCLWMCSQDRMRLVSMVSLFFGSVAFFFVGKKKNMKGKKKKKHTRKTPLFLFTTSQLSSM